MRRALTGLGIVVSLVAFGASSASAANPPVLQKFSAIVVNGLGMVSASGAVLDSRGAITPIGPLTYDMHFPEGPGSLTRKPLVTTDKLTPAACVDMTKQTGNFNFSFFPTATIGLAIFGDGPYTLSATTFFRPLPGGGCDTTGAPIAHFEQFQANATELFAIL